MRLDKETYYLPKGCHAILYEDGTAYSLMMGRKLTPHEKRATIMREGKLWRLPFPMHVVAAGMQVEEELVEAPIIVGEDDNYVITEERRGRGLHDKRSGMLLKTMPYKEKVYTWRLDYNTFWNLREKTFHYKAFNPFNMRMYADKKVMGDITIYMADGIWMVDLVSEGIEQQWWITRDGVVVMNEGDYEFEKGRLYGRYQRTYQGSAWLAHDFDKHLVLRKLRFYNAKPNKKGTVLAALRELKSKFSRDLYDMPFDMYFKEGDTWIKGNIEVVLTPAMQVQQFIYKIKTLPQW
ncbi:MAG: hypothetical protein D6746_01520 [Bacteroidetes bacterium]|nr:MAG: hypothetical protein D6746_01520 [Bacteroidota bacterium]